MSESPETDAIESMRPLAVAAAASASQAARIAQRMAERSADRARAQAEQERQLEELRREARGAYRELARREDWIGSASREDLAEAADVLGRGGDPRDRDALRRIEESGRDRFGADWRGQTDDRAQDGGSSYRSDVDEHTARAHEAEAAAEGAREGAREGAATERGRAERAREEGCEDDARGHDEGAQAWDEKASAFDAQAHQARADAERAREQNEKTEGERVAETKTSTSDKVEGEGEEQQLEVSAEKADVAQPDHGSAAPSGEAAPGAPVPAGAGARRPGLRWAQGRGRLSGRSGAAGRPSVPGRDNEAER